jgi:hypothetical protein
MTTTTANAAKREPPYNDYRAARRTINDVVDAIEFKRRYSEVSKLTDLLVNGSITIKFDSAEALYYLVNLDRTTLSETAERAFVDAIKNGNELTKNISMKYVRKILVEKEELHIDTAPDPKEDLIFSDIAEIKRRNEEEAKIFAKAYEKKINETRERSGTILRELFGSKDPSVTSKVDNLFLEVINNGNSRAKDVISPILEFYSTSTDEILQARATKLSGYDINAFLRTNGNGHK